MADRWMMDTNIIIEYLRDQPDAVAYLRSQTTLPKLSLVVVAELYAGVRDGDERRILDDFIGSVEVAPITLDIAVQGGLHCRQYRRSHGVSLPDALIAATAQAENARLVTLNQKHFPMLEQVLVPYLK